MPHVEPPNVPTPVAADTARQVALQPVEPEPGVLIHTPSDRRLAVEHWLLSAHGAPEQARREWTASGVALLPLGTLFAAVRLPARVVHAATGRTEHAEVDQALAEALDGGPVICDPDGRRYYALVPASTPARWREAARGWTGPGVECLGRGTYLGVPRPQAEEFAPERWASYWSVPMASLGELCAPELVAHLVLAGRRAIGGEAEGEA